MRLLCHGALKLASLQCLLQCNGFCESITCGNTRMLSFASSCIAPQCLLGCLICVVGLMQQIAGVHLSLLSVCINSRSWQPVPDQRDIGPLRLLNLNYLFVPFDSISNHFHWQPQRSLGCGGKRTSGSPTARLVTFW